MTTTLKSGTGLFDNSPEPMLFLTELSGPVLVSGINAAFTELFADSSFLANLTQGEPLPAEAPERRFVAEPTPGHSRLRRKTAIGWRHFRLTRIPDKCGVYLRYDDITTEVCRKEQLAVFSRVFHHDLRNNLNIMLGTAETLNSNEQIDPLRSAIDVLLETTDQLSQVVSLEEESHPMRIDSLLNRIENRYQNVICRSTAGDSLAVDHRVEVAINALLTNSLRFRESPEPIQLEVANEQAVVTLQLVAEEALFRDQDMRALRGHGELPQSDPPDTGIWLAYWLLTCCGCLIELQQPESLQIHIPILLDATSS